jgi:hypothetical protein
MSKRTRIGKRYVTRRKNGQIKTNVDVGRSLSADRRRKSKNTVKAGRGHQGDIKRAEEPKNVRGITVGQRPKMKRGWSITSHGTGHHEQRYATKDGITVLIQPIPANSYWGRQKNARYRLTYNRDVPDADSLVPQAKFFSTYEGVFDWLENPPFEIKSFDAESYGAESFEADFKPTRHKKKGWVITRNYEDYMEATKGNRHIEIHYNKGDYEPYMMYRTTGSGEYFFKTLNDALDWLNGDYPLYEGGKDFRNAESYGAETLDGDYRAEGGCSCGANSSMGGKTFAACGCGSKKKAESYGAETLNAEDIVCPSCGSDDWGEQEGYSCRDCNHVFNPYNAETFGAESRFDTLANKVAKDYESKGYSDKEAMEIGKKVAYSQGVKKYGKAGMTRLSKAGRKKAMQKSADSYSLNAELGQVNTMQATQSWQNSEPYATLEGYNPVDSVIASPPLGRGATQDFGAEYEGHQGYDDKMDESMGMRHRGKHSQSMKDRRDEASAMDKRHSKMGRKYDDVMTMDAEYDSPYGPRQSTDFGMVGMGNDFAQNAAETFSAEGGSEFMTGARYGAGAVIGITGATLILGTVMNLFMRK